MVAARGTAATAALVPSHARQMQPINARAGWLSPAAISGPVIYVSDTSLGDNSVKLYSQSGSNQQPIGEIRVVDPAGLAVDNSGNLYVASLGDDAVLMFQKGHVTPSKTYKTGISNPESVAIGKDGTVYVANDGDGKLGFVSVYRNGSVQPSSMITDFDGMALGVTTDAANDLLVTYISGFTNVGQLNIYRPGSTSGTNLNVTLNSPYSITLDSRGDYVVADEHNGLIDVFSPGAKTRLAKFAAFLPLGVAFNSAYNLLYSAEFDNGVVVRAFPSGKIVNMIGSGRVRARGIALSPPAAR